MEEKITEKIEQIVDYIISKPVKSITLNDYTILHEELKDIRFRKEQEASGDRLRQLAATVFPVSANVK
jgi:hypothetical protein